MKATLGSLHRKNGRSNQLTVYTIAQAETILRWHRELIGPNRDFKANHTAIGRPLTSLSLLPLFITQTNSFRIRTVSLAAFLGASAVMAIPETTLVIL